MSDIWRLSDGHLKDVWRVSAWCLRALVRCPLGGSGRFLEESEQVKLRQVKLGQVKLGQVNTGKVKSGRV